MSKQYKIRWSEADNKELSRVVRNYNAKVKRLEKKYQGTDVIIPEKVSMRELRGLVSTRGDLTREIKSLQRFTERGSEEIVEIPITDNNIRLTKWQRQEMSLRSAIVNRRRNKRRKELEEQELSHGGSSLGYTRGDIGMGKASETVLRPTKPFTKKMTRDDVKYKFKHLMKESQSAYWKLRDIAMREGFIKALTQNFNENDIKDVIRAIRDMPIEKFKEMLLEDPEDFSTAYPPDDEEYNAYLNKLKSIWLPKSKAPKGSSGKRKTKSKTKSKKKAGKK